MTRTIELENDNARNLYAAMLKIIVDKGYPKFVKPLWYVHMARNEVKENMNVETAIKALVKYLKENEEISEDDISVEKYEFYGVPVLSVGDREYVVMNDEESDAATNDYIKDTVWAFNADWIVSHLNTDFPVEAIQVMQHKCGDANDPIREIIEKLGDWDYFVDDSIAADGRGHFLSSYDGEENEVSFEGELYFIYRLN